MCCRRLLQGAPRLSDWAVGPTAVTTTPYQLRRVPDRDRMNVDRLVVAYGLRRFPTPRRLLDQRHRRQPPGHRRNPASAPRARREDPPDAQRGPRPVDRRCLVNASWREALAAHRAPG